MEKFYNREHPILKTFFPLLPSDGLAVEKGGFWSNPATRYGYQYISQAHGKATAGRARWASTCPTC